MKIARPAGNGGFFIALFPGNLPPIFNKVYHQGVRKMKTWVRVFMGLLLVSGLWGGLNVETTLRVKTDGSGILESTVLMNSQVREMMNQSGLGTGDKDRSLDLLDKEKLKRDAVKMGHGVRLVSAERISSKDGSGYRALYAFKDINTLKIRQNQDEPPLPNSGSKKGSPEGKITFSFKKGNPSLLTIRLPKPQEKLHPHGKEKPAEERAAQPEEKQEVAKDSMEMAKSLFQGMRMVFAVELQGAVVATNATHREGSRITLMEMDFDQLTANAEQFQNLAKAQPQNPGEIADLLRTIPGVKAELQETVTVEFR